MSSGKRGYSNCGGGGRGRGEYYKQKYGGGRGRGRASVPSPGNNDNNRGGGSYETLLQILRQIDGSNYPAYHDLETSMNKPWVHDSLEYSLFVGRAQSDPFAPPTNCRLIIPSHIAKLPQDLYLANKVRAIATSDYLHRHIHSQCRSMGAHVGSSGQGWSGPKGGDVQIAPPTQHVMEQTAVSVNRNTGDVVLQFTVNLPARGRTVLGHEAIEIFDSTLPTLVQSIIEVHKLKSELRYHVHCIEDQAWLRTQLPQFDLIAFVADGSILPRVSGAEDLPMTDDAAVPFRSPPSLARTFQLPNLDKTITGMGIPSGITLVVGGGYHGKSTLLSALQVGVYNQIPGDGREFVVCIEDTVKIRAEDGRCMSCVDISPFIRNLPFGKDTTCFSTKDASGSTSQAGNIMEGVELGAKALLIDEDTCATNFMIRDEKMMQLVSHDKEPITPLLHKIKFMHNDKGISSIIVMGGSGDYFAVADVVLMMDSYKCHDVTNRAKEIVASYACVSTAEALPSSFGEIRRRYPNLLAFAPAAGSKVAVRSTGRVSYGTTELILSGLEQIVGLAQTNAISAALQKLASGFICANQTVTTYEVLNALDALIDQDGLDVLAANHFNGALARPRRFEVAGAMNRLRVDNPFHT